ncbi:calcium:proton antiporter [Taibaiella chishuiensis]|uniref:Ca2+:H+ antiporter n=1 Tax=Taibaiella chishuiensis TaxID=1434707 RepID=A0A2P8CZI7_9BACT|nr:ionic transporter y4hA [Taibaiella chishuiensis]PSK90398.1 Ca2+:H+ antiporter [Taibaiella chishuiensis]
MKLKFPIPLWLLLTPAISWLAIALLPANTAWFIVLFLSLALITSVMASVHLAEIIAHRVGEPFGTLILALAVTIIELSLIVSLMSSGGPQTQTLARDTIFAANMILLTGIIGLSILLGALKYHEQEITKHSATSALVALISILILTLVLPNYTVSVNGPEYNSVQLIFIAIICVIIYLAFVFVQSIRHRDYFLPDTESNESDHADPPSNKTALLSLVVLLACLGAVVLLAKSLSPTIEAGVQRIGAPQSLVGVIIAMIILLPEGIAAIQAARKNRLQTSMNLALGSALASTGLTIPAVAVFSLFSNTTVVLGISTASAVLLMLSVFIVMLSLVTGKTNILYGIVLLTIFITYLFTSIVP